MAPDELKSTHGVSRRKFLKGIGGASVVGGVLADGPEGKAAAQEGGGDPATPVGPGKVSITLRVNGRKKTLSVEPRTTLRDALRNGLGLTGSKKICDRGACGACTVLKDGRPIYSCCTLAIDAQGSDLTTIEGLGSPERLSAVQSAFVKHDATQCGFCTSGFVIASTSLLKDNPNPTPDEVEAGLGGNLCRCGTYANIKLAVLDVAKTRRGGA